MHIDLQETKTQYAIGGLVVALMFIGWIIFGRGTAQNGPALTEGTTDPIETIIGRELLAALEKMKTVTLDTSLLSDPVYLSLTDLAVEVPVLPKRRRDPFAPLGTDNDGVTVKSGGR